MRGAEGVCQQLPRRLRARAAVDGDIATFWHSEYSPPTPLPQSITLNLGEVKRVGKVDYQPRFDGNLNGTLLDYKVYVSADGQSFTEVAVGTWAGDARLKTATFTPVDARYVRLEGHRALGGSYLSAAEVTVG
ncbi:discoidin domain-containing protein [Nonomuraea sp. 10N515B]|uniref:discoidin domain-containing protein n=1 Tax=Nonomuraea sp. 10N515B TaxID=3457422 RepID=UPI003FCEAEDC